MNVLCLGSQAKELMDVLHAAGDKALFSETPLTITSQELHEIDFLVSFGYRHLVPDELLVQFSQRAINLHISYLPWNRGADPNLWSFLDNTPKGVTIHYLSQKLDGGDILCQEEVSLGPDETLRSSYERLTQSGARLFAHHWSAIRTGKLAGHPQQSGGSFHRKLDAEGYRHLLRAGWDTPVKELVGKALRKEAV